LLPILVTRGNIYAYICHINSTPNIYQMSVYNIFIVEDDEWYGKILEYHFSLNPDYKVTRYTNAKDLLNNLHLQPDLITIDFSLPDMAGDKLYQKIREINSQIPVIVVSGQENITVAVNLLKMGVSDYMVKDDATKDLLWNSIIRIRENQNLKQEVAHLKEELREKFTFEKSMIGQSNALKSVFGKMEKATKTNINVSVTGETGTGKELVAKAIHYNSDRRKGSFVPVNMAAIPKELVESELFGYEKGAFTGANARKTGKFEEANGGTIFLDEIAELDLSVQSKLLRVLQEREVVRVGGNDKIKLDIRLIIATHKDLAQEVKNGNFREDLYYRIMGLPIELPPLRDRGNDVLILAKYFADEFSRQNKLGTITITQGAKDKLMRYQFPGNIRELKAIIDLAAVMCDDNQITGDDISFNSIRRDEGFTMEKKTLRQFTCDIIKFYLKKNNDDVVATANELDMGKSTIYKMMQSGEIT